MVRMGAAGALRVVVGRLKRGLGLAFAVHSEVSTYSLVDTIHGAQKGRHPYLCALRPYGLGMTLMALGPLRIPDFFSRTLPAEPAIKALVSPQ
jgi:hypothetical protein